MITIAPAINSSEWDSFLSAQTYRPFLQSFTMGLVYKDIGQEPVRLIVKNRDQVQAICFGHIVNARRGKHLSVPYGPVLAEHLSAEEKNAVLTELFAALKAEGKKYGCAFVRMSPFWPADHDFSVPKTVHSPLHLLAEHVWYLSLKGPSEEELLAVMRKTTRNLIRRAEKDGVTVEESPDPVRDLHHFIRLHDETRKRHGFTPYTNAFFESQVRRFAERKEVSLYLAKFQGEVIATSIHMHAFGETSYHHGASSSAYSKIPSSYLLQWTAIRDALKRGDHLYNFWGIAPLPTEAENSNVQIPNSKKHPFAGVTLFKTGFGGQMLPLVHCMDIPLTSKYWFTYAFEMVRKWRRGF